MAILILKVNPAGSFFPPSRQCWSWRVHNCLIYTGTKLFPGLPHLSIKSFISMTFCFSLNQTSLSLLSTAVHVCVLTMWWFSPGVTAIKSCCKSLCGHGRKIRWSNIIFVSLFGKNIFLQLMQHDSYFCEKFPGSNGFPTERIRWNKIVILVNMANQKFHQKMTVKGGDLPLRSAWL